MDNKLRNNEFKKFILKVDVLFFILCFKLIDREKVYILIGLLSF